MAEGQTAAFCFGGVCVDGTSASERTQLSNHQAGHQCGVVQVASAAAAAASACIFSSSFTHGRVPQGRGGTHEAPNPGGAGRRSVCAHQPVLLFDLLLSFAESDSSRV